jgi:hypothetical protein
MLLSFYQFCFSIPNLLYSNHDLPHNRPMLNQLSQPGHCTQFCPFSLDRLQVLRQVISKKIYLKTKTFFKKKKKRPKKDKTRKKELYTNWIQEKIRIFPHMHVLYWSCDSLGPVIDLMTKGFPYNRHNPRKRLNIHLAFLQSSRTIACTILMENQFFWSFGVDWI